MGSCWGIKTHSAASFPYPADGTGHEGISPAAAAEEGDEKEREERYEEPVQGLQNVLWYFKERQTDQAEAERRRHGTVPDV